MACGCMLRCFSHAQLFETPWTVAHQAPLPWYSPGKNTGVGCQALLSGTELVCLTSPALAGRFFTTSTTWDMGRRDMGNCCVFLFFFPPLFYKIYQMSVEAAGLGVRRNLWRGSAPWMLQPHSSSRRRLRLKQYTKLGRLSHVAGGTVPLEGNLGTSIKISSSYAQPCHF